jgi:isoleucyl-tRNA synthetase
VCLGLLLAEDGRKMSKHLGNVLLPMPLMDQHGADAVRWFMAASGSPWAARRVGDAALQEIVRKVLLTYWNTVAFHVLYAETNGWTPSDGAPARGDRHVVDRWLLSQRDRLTRDVTSALDAFDTQRAGLLLSAFIDDLSNWYVRRSRRRFWDGDPAALATLHETLEVLTRLLAPIVPFVTERVWQDLVRSVDTGAAESVHLASWPDFDDATIDDDLDAGMALTRRLVELGRSARAEAKVRTRQPLHRVLIPSAAYASLSAELRAEIAAEINVETVESFSSAGDLLTYEAKGNFRALGKRFAERTPGVAAAIARADAAQLATELAERGKATINLADPGDGGRVELGPDEVILTERPREGWSVVNEHGETVALDLTLTPQLLRAGVAREAVRLIQEARKSAGLDVADRITLVWSGSGATAEALREHADLVAAEVLAVSMTEAAQPEASWQIETDLGLAFALTRAQRPAAGDSP